MVHNSIKQWSSRLLVLGTLLAVLCGCYKQARTEKYRQESIQTAEQADSTEEEELAERERQEATTWTGATSIEELRRKLDGTTWTSNPDDLYGGVMYKFVFDNGIIKRYSARGRDGQWNSDYLSFSYTIEQAREDNGKKFAAVIFGDGSDLLHAVQAITFIDHCQTALWFLEGKLMGKLNYGDFEWSDEL